MAGGGVDVTVSQHWAMRVGPVDWLHMSGPSSAVFFQSNNIRLVFRFFLSQLKTRLAEEPGGLSCVIVKEDARSLDSVPASGAR
jgi:hypothetical protein